MQTHDLEAIKAAKIDLSHFAKYFGYLRVSVSMWMHGRCVPHKWRADKLSQDLSLVRMALKTGALPVNVSIRKGKARYEAVARALDEARMLSH
jgi:hypothetical protein